MIAKVLLPFFLFTSAYCFGDEAVEQKQFVSEVFSRLPKELSSLASKTSITFRDLNRGKTSSSECKTGETFGYTKKTTRGYEIVLDSSVPRFFAQAEPLSNCSHKDSKTLAFAILAHEMAHVYDFENKLTSQENFKRAFSFILEDRRHGRSPDLYEFTSATEAFPVNVEHFLVDPQYACRRPTLERYFEGLFPSFSSFKADCSYPEVRVGDLSSGAVENRVLDLKRIYQIHYLLAGPGKEASSTFGHSMIRIVQCAPNRDEVSEKCLSDIQDHIVVSFRANVTGLTMNNIAGLTGKYPSQMFFLSMADVITDYNISEDRELFSIPLDFTAEEIEHFLASVQETYWEYSGSYKFLTNNCATETFSLVQNALFHRPIAQARPGILTPHEVLRNLTKYAYTDTSDLNLLRERKKGQLYFPPFLRAVESGLEKLKQSGLVKRELSLDQLSKNPSALNVRALLNDVDTLGVTDRRQIIVGLIALEDFIQRKLEALWQAELTHRMNRRSGDSQGNDFSGVTKLLWKLEPYNVATGGYGVPQATEVLTHESQEALLKEVGEVKGKLLRSLQEHKSAREEDLETRITDVKEVKRQLLQKLKRP